MIRKMSIKSVNKSSLICRTCISEVNVDETVSVFKRIPFENKYLELSHMIFKLTNLMFRSDDAHPQVICNECVSEACEAYFFREKCIESQDILDLVSKNEKKIFQPKTLNKIKSFQNKQCKPEFLSVDIDTTYDEVDNKIVTQSATNYRNIVQDSNSRISNEKRNISTSTVLPESFNVKQEPHFEEMIIEEIFCPTPKMFHKIDSSTIDIEIQQPKHEEIFKCNSCEKLYYNFENLMDHINNDHTDENNDIENVKPSSVMKNENTSGFSNYAEHYCGRCDENFSNNEEFSNHNTLFHSEMDELLNEMFDEDDCDDDNSRKIDSPIQIEHCISETTQNDHNYNAEESQVNALPFKCQFCSTYFSTYKAVCNHRKRYHSNRANEFLTLHQMIETVESEKMKKLKDSSLAADVECEFCNLKFKTYITMRRHRKKMHPEKSGQSLRYGTSNALNKTPLCICDFCGKTLANLSSLEVHKRGHTGERPHACQSCSSTFTSVHGLRDHEKRHLETISFFCDICNKGFTRKRNLVWHRKTHDPNDRPHKCHVCDKGFLYRAKLILHLRAHRGEKPYRIYEQNRPHRIRKKKPKVKSEDTVSDATTKITNL